MDWYCVIGGRKVGPLPQEKVQALAREGEVTPETPVWCKGMEGWEPAKQALPEVLSPAPDGADAEQDTQHTSEAGDEAVCPSCGKTVPKSQLTQVDGRSLCIWCKAKLDDEITARDMAAMVAAGARKGGVSNSLRDLTGKFQQKMWHNPAFWERYRGAVMLTGVVACAVIVALAAECIGMRRFGLLVPRLVASAAVVLVAKNCGALDSHYGKFVLAALALFFLDDIVTGLRIGYRYRLVLPCVAYTLLAIAVWGLGFDIKYFWSAVLPMAFLGCLVLSACSRAPRITLLLILGTVTGSIAMAAMSIGARVHRASLLVPTGAVTLFVGSLCLLQGRYGGSSLVFALAGIVLHYAGASLLAFSVAHGKS
jgi:GYF domain 2